MTSTRNWFNVYLHLKETLSINISCSQTRHIISILAQLTDIGEKPMVVIGVDVFDQDDPKMIRMSSNSIYLTINY